MRTKRVQHTCLSVCLSDCSPISIFIRNDSRMPCVWFCIYKVFVFFSVLILNAPSRWRQSAAPTTTTKKRKIVSAWQRDGAVRVGCWHTYTKTEIRAGGAWTISWFTAFVYILMHNADATGPRSSLQILCVNIAGKRENPFPCVSEAPMVSAFLIITSIICQCAMCVRNEPNNDADDWTLSIFILPKQTITSHSRPMCLRGRRNNSTILI